MKKRILTIILCLNLFSLLSCFDCSDYKYYDYSGIKILVHNPFVALEDENLSLSVRYEGTTYLSQTKKINNFGSSLYAFDCDKGFGGEKYPLVRISITSDSDFNSEYLANNELNDIVYARGTNIDGEYVLDKVSNFQPSKINLAYFFISLKPETDKTHKITIEIEKSNREILSATSEEITWE